MKSCTWIDTLNDDNKFIYLLNFSGSTIKEVARFLHSAYKACLAEVKRSFLFSDTSLFKLNAKLSSFVFMLTMFMNVFCEYLI